MENVNKVIKHGNSLHGLEHDDAVRKTKIENEVVKWRALLPKSEY